MIFQRPQKQQFRCVNLWINSMNRISSMLSMLGPGLIWAGAAVGVSHLVQSTQAGARFGFSMVLVVILANLLKYPFFEFGSRFAASTGHTLMSGYKKLGNWAFYLYLVLTVLTMFIIQAVVTMVTAGIVLYVFDMHAVSVQMMSLLILLSSMVVLILGHYSLLDNFIKYIVITLTVVTIAAVVIAFGNVQGSERLLAVESTLNPLSFIDNNLAWLFLIPLIGWMPAPIDVSVWGSIWTTEKQKQNVKGLDLKSSLLDFNIGYVGTAFIALCFLSLGALMMYGTGVDFSGMSSVKFAETLLTMYTESIGEWSKYLVGFAALATMVSTTITCLDAYGRVCAKSLSLIKYEHDEDERSYAFWVALTILGAMLVLYAGKYLGESLPAMVAFATTLSFLTAPVLGYLNMRLIQSDLVPKQAQPGKKLMWLSWFGLTFLSVFSLIYLGKMLLE